jgi:hypothetical protein
MLVASPHLSMLLSAGGWRFSFNFASISDSIARQTNIRGRERVHAHTTAASRLVNHILQWPIKSSNLSGSKEGELFAAHAKKKLGGERAFAAFNGLFLLVQHMVPRPALHDLARHELPNPLKAWAHRMGSTSLITDWDHPIPGRCNTIINIITTTANIGVPVVLKDSDLYAKFVHTARGMRCMPTCGTGLGTWIQSCPAKQFLALHNPV